MNLDNNKSDFEDKIFHKLYDIVDSLNKRKTKDYKGCSDFFKFYFETYIAYVELCDKLGMLTTSNNLGNFFRRYNYHLWINMLEPIISTKELLRCIKPSRCTKEDFDYVVYYDNGVITQNGIVLYPEGGQIPSDAISCFVDIDDCESRFFSTHEFIENYSKKDNKIDLELILEELFECLCFKNYNILDNVVSECCEDIEEVYPYLVDDAVEQYNKHVDYDTKRIVAYADLCKDYTMNEVPSKAWERLFLRDIQILKALMDHTIKEIDSTTRSLYYERGDLLFIQENVFAAEFLFDIYTDKSLFLYECKKIGCNSLFFEAIQDLFEDNYDILFYWIHRCNLIKAERDAGISKMKQYIEFIRNGNAERGIDIIKHMVENDTNDDDILDILMKEKENSISFGNNGIKATQDEVQTFDADEVNEALCYDDDNDNDDFCLAESNAIFNPRIMTTEEHCRKVRDVILRFTKQEGVASDVEQINPSAQNEWYYIMKGIRESGMASSSMGDKKFVEQMVAWLPDLFAEKIGEGESKDFVRNFAKSISAERNKYWTEGTENKEVAIIDMHAHARTRNIDSGKVKRAFLIANGLKKALEELKTEIQKAQSAKR